MTELSNVATVLISRMESHPEDFSSHGSRFGYLQDSLYALIGITTNNPYGGLGRLAYLTDADRAALAEAWRKLNYVKFEKEVMEMTFKSDAEFEEERKQFMYPTTAQQRVQMQNVMMQSTGTTGPQPVTALNAAQNSSGNTGLFGSTANGFLSGIFGK